MEVGGDCIVGATMQLLCWLCHPEAAVGGISAVQHYYELIGHNLAAVLLAHQATTRAQVSAVHDP